MNLVIDFDENMIQSAVSKTVNNLFKESQYTNNGELFDYIKERTRIAATQLISEIDMIELIKESTLCYTKGIVNEVVKKEIERMVKAQVKELKAKGQLV